MLKKILLYAVLCIAAFYPAAGCGKKADICHLNVNIAAGGGGTVNPAGLTRFKKNQVVELYPSPAEGYEFHCWSGPHGPDVQYDDGTWKILMDGHKSVIAAFARPGTVTPVPTPSPAPLPSPGVKDWNFLVYLDGDNNLEMQGIIDLNEMEKIGSTEQVNILVLFDGDGKPDPYYGSVLDDTRLYYVTKDDDINTIGSQEIGDWYPQELDMSDPNTLREFIVFCQENYPARRTALTLWNHGGGVWPRSFPYEAAPGLPPVLRGICWDDTTGRGDWDCLTTDEVAQALSQARAQTNRKVDIINLDVCLTQSWRLPMNGGARPITWLAPRKMSRAQAMTTPRSCGILPAIPA